jgi:hypothetical protein
LNQEVVGEIWTTLCLSRGRGTADRNKFMVLGWGVSAWHRLYENVESTVVAEIDFIGGQSPEQFDLINIMSI